MEFQKIANFLDTTSDDKELPIFFSKKWIKVMINQKKLTTLPMKSELKTSMLRPDLCDFSDAYIIVKEAITVTNPDGAKRNKSIVFKNNAPFINGISKINGAQIDNAEDLGVVMPMDNLLK